MSFTINQFASTVRAIVQDVDGTRYPSSMLLGALNTALTELRRIRPDVLSIQEQIPHFPYTNMAADGNRELPVGDVFFGPLVSYVSGWLELSDDEFTTDGRAATLLARFTAQLTQGG